MKSVSLHNTQCGVTKGARTQNEIFSISYESPSLIFTIWSFTTMMNASLPYSKPSFFVAYIWCHPLNDLHKCYLQAPELVNTVDSEGYSPIQLAVIAGNTSLINYLIEEGADLQCTDNEGHTVVHWATGNPQILGLLLHPKRFFYLIWVTLMLFLDATEQGFYFQLDV